MGRQRRDRHISVMAKSLSSGAGGRASNPTAACKQSDLEHVMKPFGALVSLSTNWDDVT